MSRVILFPRMAVGAERQAAQNHQRIAAGWAARVPEFIWQGKPDSALGCQRTAQKHYALARLYLGVEQSF